MTLHLTPPFAILEPVEEPILGTLNWIHETIGVSWAWAIILLTIAVRILLIPLTVKQQQSMRKLQALQPEIKKLQAKHKGDRQTLNQEMMALYKDNKANPMGSCLPLLVQIPIFMAMFFVLRDIEDEFDSDDNRSFLGGFLPDISDYLHQLPTSTLVILMAVYIGSQVGSTLLMPTSLDKVQRYLFLALPIVFAFVLIQQDFAAALMLYWITTNLWTVGQAAVIRWVFPNPHLATASASVSPSAGGTRKPTGGGATKPRGATQAKAKGAKPETKGVHPAARKARTAKRPGEGSTQAASASNGGAPAGRARRRRGGTAPAAPPADGTRPSDGNGGPAPGRRRGRRSGQGEAPAAEGGG
jgi:YidC/Oxa1 family membrane protein insertase